MLFPVRTLAAALLAVGVTAATPALAQVTFYVNDNFEGRSFSTSRAVGSFTDIGFNDRASSIVVSTRVWEVCDDSDYGGRCMMLRPGNYPSLRAMGMNDRISSVRPVRAPATLADDRYAPEPPAPSQWRRRNGERLFEAPVTDVRAVVGVPEQRCWLERQDVPVDRGRETNVPGAVLGAVLGGVLGHQIGGGTGRDIATAGGAVAGGVVGSRVGRERRDVESREVQRCASVPSQKAPEYWDVSYSFRGQDHRVQLKQPPGPSVTVNRQGEPRE